MSAPLRVGSLFSGIGGIDLGLERAGMVVKWQVELDDYCNRVLAKHWPNVPRFRDVRDCNASNLAPVDLLCGGFPCQDVSLAGKRAGLDGQRSTLWSEFARLIGELRPRWVLAENVPGLLSANDGRFFGTVLRDLAACGYDAEWNCLPAAAFGAPHRRERVFIVANAAGDGNTNREKCAGWNFAEQLGSTFSNTNKRGLAQRKSIFENYAAEQLSIERSDWWFTEPQICRVADGVPARVDRLRGLGNAVVPQVAEWIGRRIVEADAMFFGN